MYRAMLFVDPGLRSGWASWEARKSGNVFRCGIADPEDLCDTMERWANEHAGTDSLMGSESFHISEETAHKDQSAMGWPLELLGVCRYLARLNELRFDTQKPGDMKGFVGADRGHEKLKRYGWHTPGAEAHARDASGHLLLALISRGMHP